MVMTVVDRSSHHRVHYDEFWASGSVFSLPMPRILSCDLFKNHGCQSHRSLQRFLGIGKCFFLADAQNFFYKSPQRIGSPHKTRFALRLFNYIAYNNLGQVGRRLSSGVSAWGQAAKRGQAAKWGPGCQVRTIKWRPPSGVRLSRGVKLSSDCHSNIIR